MRRACVGIFAYKFRRVRNTSNSNGVGHSEPIPDGLDPTRAFERFLQRLERIASQPVVHCCPTPPLPLSPLRIARDKLLERFRPLYPESFDGFFDQGKAEQWFQGIDTSLMFWVMVIRIRRDWLCFN